MLKWRKKYDTKIFKNDKLTWKEKLDVFLRLVEDDTKVTVCTSDDPNNNQNFKCQIKFIQQFSF